MLSMFVLMLTPYINFLLLLQTHTSKKGGHQAKDTKTRTRRDLSLTSAERVDDMEHNALIIVIRGAVANNHISF